jgi:hypothetical protein
VKRFTFKQKNIKSAKSEGNYGDKKTPYEEKLSTLFSFCQDNLDRLAQILARLSGNKVKSLAVSTCLAKAC